MGHIPIMSDKYWLVTYHAETDGPREFMQKCGVTIELLRLDHEKILVDVSKEKGWSKLFRKHF